MPAVVLISAGCGRVGFDRLGTGGDDTAQTDSGSECGPPGAIVHLAFDEGSGLQTRDVSGSGNDAQLIGMDESDWVPGRIGEALDFDGVDDHVSAGSAIGVDDVAPLTMCAWIAPRSYPSQFPAIADKSNDTFIGGWNFYIENNAELGFLTNQRKWITGGAIRLGDWNHVCAAWDGSSGLVGIQLFQDGVMVPMKNSGSNGNQLDSDAAHDVLVGRVNNGTYPFDGVVDDFLIYPRVLTAQEIAAVYDCGR
jgi:hypothetical protein